MAAVGAQEGRREVDASGGRRSIVVGAPGAVWLHTESGSPALVPAHGGHKGVFGAGVLECGFGGCGVGERKSEKWRKGRAAWVNGEIVPDLTIRPNRKTTRLIQATAIA